MYASARDPLLSAASRETFEAVEVLNSLARQPYVPEGGAEYPRGRFGDSLYEIARLIKSGAGLEVAFTDIGGGDHHVNEAAPLANLLAQFAQGLAAFWRDLDSRAENVALVLGGGIRGGKVYGDRPGLSDGQLYEDRDLAVTTDFRTVLGELVGRRLGNRDLAAVSPSYKGGAESFRGIVKG